MARQQFYNDFLVPEIGSRSSLLANLEFPRDFYRYMAPVSVGLQNFEYRDRATNAPAKLLLFGEISTASKLSSTGNHYMGRDDEAPIKLRDGSKARDALNLIVPKDATDELQTLFDNQFVTLNQIYCSDYEFDTSRNVRTSNITECSEVEPTLDPDEIRNIAKVLLQLKFAPDDKSPTKAAISSTRAVQKKVVGAAASAVQPPPVDPPEPSSDGSDVELGKLYDASLMPDFNADHFDLVCDKLRQHDVRHSNGSLIPAWDNMKQLSPGTIVGVVATLQAFNIGTAPGVYKRIYHLRAQSVYVLYDAEDSEDSDDSVPAEPEQPVKKAITATADFKSLVDKRKAMSRAQEEDQIASSSHPSPPSSAAKSQELVASPLTELSLADPSPRESPTASSVNGSTSIEEHSSENDGHDVEMSSIVGEAVEGEEEKRLSSKAKGKRKAS